MRGQSKKLFRLYSKTILQLEYITLQPFLPIKNQGGKNANKKSGQRSRKIPRKGEAAGANLWTLRQRHSKSFRDFAVYALYISLQTVWTINRTAWKDCGNFKA